MKQIERIKQLFTYNDWANRETLRSLLQMDSPPEDAVQRMGHIVGAEEIWYHRITGTSPLDDGGPPVVWPALTLQESERRVMNMKHRWAALFAEKDEAYFGNPLTYSNSKGDRFESRVDDILMHLYAHGAYHRGQIAFDLRQHGGQPASTDFIFALRSGALGK